MNNPSDSEIIKGYLYNYAGDKNYFWAFEEVQALLSADVERAWKITCEMIRITADESALAYIAAGPLEDLLKYHGATFIDRVERLAQNDPHFRSALMGVWGLRTPILERVEKVCNKK